MFNEALWKKHYKQTKYLIWGFILVSFIYPFNIYNEDSIVKNILENNLAHGISKPHYYSMFDPSIFVSLFQMIILVGMAAVLLGLERFNQSLDFTLSLPYSRKEIILNKWQIGFFTILSANGICFLITSFILYDSALLTFFPYYSFVFYYVASSIYLIGIYSFSLFIGQFVGNHFGQFVLTWIFLFLPIGLFTLFAHTVTFHFDFFTQTTFELQRFIYSTDEFFMAITMPIGLLSIDFAIENAQLQGYIDFDRYLALLMPIAITLLYLFTIKFNARVMKSENNGKLILFNSLQPFFIISVVTCFYLFGGMLFSTIIEPRYAAPPSSLMTFHIGGILFAFVSFIVVRLLLGKSLKLKFGEKI